MEQNLYIIGDLVQYQDTIYHIAGFRIDYRNNYIYSIEYDGSSIEIKGDYLTPIPLTPKILEKNGWEKDDRGYSIKDLIFLNKNGLGGWSVGIGDEFIVTISYVYQLQHLLFGLGLDSNIKL